MQKFRCIYKIKIPGNHFKALNNNEKFSDSELDDQPELFSVFAAGVTKVGSEVCWVLI